MFINVSNHPSELWSTQQKKAAEEYGKILDLPFPAIPASADTDDVCIMAEEYCKKILGYEKPVVMVQGEFVFTYILVNKLREAGIRTVAACSERVSEETIDADGKSVKKSVFRFIRFRDFYRFC